jgi:hypothetical protein
MASRPSPSISAQLARGLGIVERTVKNPWSVVDGTTKNDGVTLRVVAFEFRQWLELGLPPVAAAVDGTRGLAPSTITVFHLERAAHGKARARVAYSKRSTWWTSFACWTSLVPAMPVGKSNDGPAVVAGSPFASSCPGDLVIEVLCQWLLLDCRRFGFLRRLELGRLTISGSRLQ